MLPPTKGFSYNANRFNRTGLNKAFEHPIPYCVQSVTMSRLVTQPRVIITIKTKKVSLTVKGSWGGVMAARASLPLKTLVRLLRQLEELGLNLNSSAVTQVRSSLISSTCYSRLGGNGLVMS